jgi:hypothetical protein
VNNLATASAALEAAGWPLIATAGVTGGAASIFAYHQGPGGILVELIDRPVAAAQGICTTQDSPFCPPIG